MTTSDGSLGIPRPARRQHRTPADRPARHHRSARADRTPRFKEVLETIATYDGDVAQALRRWLRR